MYYNCRRVLGCAVVCFGPLSYLKLEVVDRPWQLLVSSDSSEAEENGSSGRTSKVAGRTMLWRASRMDWALQSRLRVGDLYSKLWRSIDVSGLSTR